MPSPDVCMLFISHIYLNTESPNRQSMDHMQSLKYLFMIQLHFHSTAAPTNLYGSPFKCDWYHWLGIFSFPFQDHWGKFSSSPIQQSWWVMRSHCFFDAYCSIFIGLAIGLFLISIPCLFPLPWSHLCIPFLILFGIEELSICY